MQIDEQGVDITVHDEFASDDASLEVDALDVVTPDVTCIPGMFLHDDLDDLSSDDLSVIPRLDVDFLFFDDYVVKLLILSSAS